MPPGRAAQHGGGEDRRRRRAGQPDPQLVDDEHPVGVAVEGQPDVEPAGQHPGPQVALVGRLQRVGGVVRERAVELAVHHLELDLRQALEHGRHDEPAHPVGRVGDDPQRPQRRRVDERQDVVDELGQQVGLPAAPRPGGGRRAVAVEDGGGDRLDLAEPVGADRPGALRGTS